MSACTFLASDIPLNNYTYLYNKEIFIGKNNNIEFYTNRYLSLFEKDNVIDYTNKKYGVEIQWDYDEELGEKIIDYISDVLKETECIELWSIWNSDENPNDIKKFNFSIKNITPDLLKMFELLEFWINPRTNKPTFYCINITR